MKRFSVGLPTAKTTNVYKLGFYYPLLYFNSNKDWEIKKCLKGIMGYPAQEYDFRQGPGYKASWRTDLKLRKKYYGRPEGWVAQEARWYMGSAHWGSKGSKKDQCWIVFRTEKDRDTALTWLSFMMENK